MTFYFEKYLSQSQLLAEYERASKDWPFITLDEQAYHLPYMLMYAVGSRETNLQNVVGDNGHGHGVFQLDNRSHAIPNGFDQDVRAQSAKAAGMLKSLLDQFNGNAQRALAAYNAGVGTVEYNVSHGLNVDTGTANGDYSRDVLSRMAFLANTVKDDPMSDPTVQQQVKETHDRVMGMLQQRYYVIDANGVARSAPANAPGAKPCAVLDTLDGAYIVGLINALTVKVNAITAKPGA